jgi:putative transposase
MQTVIPLEPGQYFHIYNRGVNRNNIFVEERNYAFFMQLYAKHVAPVAETYAYCLLRNHFHILVRIRTHREPPDRRADQHPDRLGFENRVGLNEDRGGLVQLDRRAVSQAFNNLLSAYAKAVNKAAGRTGSLFQHHFGRSLVTSDRYFASLIHYIHYNPQRHGLVEDFSKWAHSSYRALLSDKPTRLERSTVLNWFGGAQEFRRFHTQAVDNQLFVCLLVTMIRGTLLDHSSTSLDWTGLD